MRFLVLLLIVMLVTTSAYRRKNKKEREITNGLLKRLLEKSKQDVRL